MAKWKPVIISAVLLIASIVIASCLIVFCPTVQELVFSKLYTEETIYSSGFNSENWHNVRLGDTIEKVKNILGDPLDESYDKIGMLWCYYTKQGQNKAYRVRILVFDNKNTVKRKIEDFYLD